jgi:RNA polymerase-binding transcription factor DksA
LLRNCNLDDGGAALPETEMNAEALDETEDLKQFARRHLLGWYAQLRAQGDANLREEQAVVSGAVGRLDSGTWGECVRCRGAIGTNRLRAMPEARCCLDCRR